MVNSKQNLQDANVAAEELVSELVNILLDCRFKCTSEIKANYPGIDAIDKVAKLGLQISHDKSNNKINTTIDKIKNNKVNQHIDVLYFFITSRKQVKYNITSACPGLSVVGSNILDFNSLSDLLSKDENRLARAENELMRAMPRLYQDGKARYEAMLDSILVARNEMDRGVFHDSHVMEDPVKMLKSMKEMKISIQKGGIMNSADPFTGAAFREILRLISSAEEKVATEFNEGFRRFRKNIPIRIC